MFEAITSMRAQHKLLLSGTPVQNSPADLWSLCKSHIQLTHFIAFSPLFDAWIFIHAKAIPFQVFASDFGLS
jgi:SNF2 family DNA or RNA helicase